MKKLLAIAVLGFLFVHVQGQWYSRQFNVNSIDELSQAQLNYALERAGVNLKTGKIFLFRYWRFCRGYAYCRYRC